MSSERFQDNPGSTHYAECWRVHPECAYALGRQDEREAIAHADALADSTEAVVARRLLARWVALDPTPDHDLAVETWDALNVWRRTSAEQQEDE